MISIIILITASSLFAQSEYLKDGEYGFDLGVGLQTTQNSQGDISALSLMFGLDGKVDLGIQIGKINGASIYAPYLGFYLLNENRTGGFFISISGFLQPEFLITKGRTESVFSAGGIMSKKIHLSENTGLRPSFTLAYSASEYTTGETYHYGVSFFVGKKVIKQITIGRSTFQNSSSMNLSFSLLFIGKRSSTPSSDTYILD